jgi:hypothetical protein
VFPELEEDWGRRSDGCLRWGFLRSIEGVRMVVLEFFSTDEYDGVDWKKIIC